VKTVALILGLLLLAYILFHAVIFFLVYREQESTNRRQHQKKKALQKKSQLSEKNYLDGLNKACKNSFINNSSSNNSSNNKTNKEKQILLLLKYRLDEAFELRWDYEHDNSTSQEEQYNESCVMPVVIKKLGSYWKESNLIHYCALVLDGFDKNRDYKYGLREDKAYKLRYIYGSIESLVKSEISEIETVYPGFLEKVAIQQKQLENEFCEQYVESEKLKVKNEKCEVKVNPH